MRHFPVPSVRDEIAGMIAQSRADLSRHRAQVDSLHAVTAHTRKRVRETRELLASVETVLQQFNKAWRRSPWSSAGSDAADGSLHATANPWHFQAKSSK
jgi:hypothetical protein